MFEKWMILLAKKCLPDLEYKRYQKDLSYRISQEALNEINKWLPGEKEIQEIIGSGNNDIR